MEIKWIECGNKQFYILFLNLSNGDKISCIITSDPSFSCGVTLSDTSEAITMIVSPVLLPSITITSSGNEICPGTAVTFTATVQNAGSAPVYQWKLNDLPVGNGSAIFTYNNFSNNDKLVCEVRGSGGSCSGNAVSSAPEIITVKPVPVISIIPADTIVYIGTQVQIRTNISSSLNSFQWTPASELINPNSLNPLTVPLTDNAEFQLSVIGSNGCAAVAKNTIKIFTKLAMPSAFTPNGDGINDVFRIPPGVRMTLNGFTIYDRWGNRVFDTKDPGKGWDGTVGGVKKDSGAFAYVISGKDDNGPVFMKGVFLLIR